MPPAVQATTKPLLQQLVVQCRAEPLVFDDVRTELCPALEQIILDRWRRAQGRSIGSLNIGGWKSGEDFFSWPDKAVQELRHTIVTQIGAPSPVAWTMVNRAGSQHPRHQHRIATLSGIYYVTAGDESASTPTIFECPCNAIQRYDLEIEPDPGRLVLCSGEMWHRLPIYAGESPRITIVFDVRR
jgi:hypothetical protein